ncbi:MAG: hypothetical protein V1934_08465, partial [Methanobacteriota archaeon]
NVVVSKARQVKRTDGTSAFKYVCVDGEGKEIGVTRSTDIEAAKGDTIEVAVHRLERDFDDSIVWTEAKVIKKLPADTKPTERKVLEKLAK